MPKFTLAIKDLDSNTTTSFDAVAALSPLAAIQKAVRHLGLVNYKVVHCGLCNLTQIRSGHVDL